MSTPLPQSLGNLSLVETVCRIRDTVTQFGRRIGGSSEFSEDLIAGEGMGLPYCWVVPLAEYGDEINQDEGTQVRHTVMAFIVCVDNTKQKGGQGSQAPRVHDSIFALQDAIEQSLLEWEPESIKLDSPIEWKQRIPLGFDNTEAHYQLEFEFVFVKFSPYYLPKPLRDTMIAESNGDVTTARQIKQIAVRYNVEEDVIRQSLEDGYFAMPNTATAPPPEEVAGNWSEANVLDVEDSEDENDIEQVESGSMPVEPYTGHGIKNEP